MRSSTTATPATATALTTSPIPGGTLSCRGLEQLREKAGGSSARAFMTAEVAMAESSGRQFATGPVGEQHPLARPGKGRSMTSFT
jgi:hypothetical protein